MYVYHGSVWSLHQVPQRWIWQSLNILVVVGPTWTSSRFCWDSSEHPERESGCYAWHPYAMIPWCFAYNRTMHAISHTTTPRCLSSPQPIQMCTLNSCKEGFQFSLAPPTPSEESLSIKRSNKRRTRTHRRQGGPRGSV